VIVLASFLTGRKIFLPVFLLGMIATGVFWARLDEHIPANAIQNFLGPDRVTLRGTVVSLPELKTRGKKTTVSLILRAHSITGKKGKR
jgi:hypothetical protein